MLEAYHRIEQIEEDALKNAILAVLLDSKDDAKSLKEIADEMDLDINTYVGWISVREALVQLPEALPRWGLVALERRQREDSRRFWYYACSRTDPTNRKWLRWRWLR